MDEIRSVERWCRWCLGLVWIYEGLVPKLIWVHELPVQSALVERSRLYLFSPEATLIAMGVGQLTLGVLLLVGWRARACVGLATAAMLALIVLVGWNRPEMWVDPFGAFAKDLCLLACAVVVWKLRAGPAAAAFSHG